MNTNPARGMRDFLPSDVRKRNYVIGVIKEVYEKYGFEPLETPSVENLETLTGKYGDEGNQLMFKILKRGEKLQNELEAGNIKSENELSDLALRYDLTVPLARVVANYKNDLPKFFKRYQIQPVWRADRPARGRYREFYQCDVDAIGSSSMIVEAELISAVSEILDRLGFEDILIRINHRELLFALLRTFSISEDKMVGAIVALDKIDKIGESGLKKDFSDLGISEDSTKKLLTAMEFFIKYSVDKTMTTDEKLNILNVFKLNQKLDFQSISETQKAISVTVNEDGSSVTGEGVDLPQNLIRNIISLDHLNLIFNKSDEGKASTLFINKLWRLLVENGYINNIKIDPTLARGLSYYTGSIFEVALTNGDFAGSIGGGGRYDGLIGMFGKEQIPAVGFSLGLERILLIMEERGMFPADLQTNSADVMVTIWNEETASESLKLAAELRAEGLRVLVYPEADKLGKQFKYADSVNIPYVCILGETELAERKVALKNMKTGEQEQVMRDAICAKIIELNA